jgi:Sulfotransferase family
MTSADRATSPAPSAAPGTPAAAADATADAATARGPEAGPAPGRVPDFYIVGHQKCGTTALYLMLGRHPQVFMPEVKEPKYFASDLRSVRRVRSPAAQRLRTLDGYLSLFADARPDQLVGEASPQYLRSRVAAGAIAELRHDAKIIAILREPTSFLRSFHLQMVAGNVELERDFRKAIELEALRRQGKRIPPRCHYPGTLQYSDHVRYVEQLSRFHEAFGRENVLVLIYDDFRADNEATVRRVLRFLELDDALPVETIDTKPLKAVRSMGLFHLANAARRARTNPPAAGRIGRAVNALTPAPLRSEANRARWRRFVYRTPPPPDEAFMLELRRRFKGEVVAVSEYLGVDLVSRWGYDRLD